MGRWMEKDEAACWIFPRQGTRGMIPTLTKLIVSRLHVCCLIL
jgi:hypothetical protein